ncbi:MAG TPA: hypothetical protein VFC75_00425 [Erysipelothrix sp.]|nr:hypothetical protein [Erysipelothrix sp.]
MNYKVEILENIPLTVARMKMTIPDYSTDLGAMAVNTMRKELTNKGVILLEPAYNFLETHDSKYRLEVIDIEVNVGVEDAGKDGDMIKFVTLPEIEKLIRITANNFEDIHIGLAEWMHEHDYEADGNLRTIVHSGPEFIYDCPVKPAED